VNPDDYSYNTSRKVIFSPPKAAFAAFYVIITTRGSDVMSKYNKIHWTKPLYDSFVSDAILTDLEKKVLYARVWENDKWTITSMSLEFNVSRSTINNCIASIRRKYDYLSSLNPDKYPERQKVNKN
jgi:hypothetical protein